MNSPKISIVIPSFNKVRYINQTLDSIFTQKYQNLEVIIQDGKSTDGTVSIIKKYAKKYPKTIKYESKRDNGQLDAVNKGFKKTTGEILTYINADDIYEKKAFESVAKAYLKNPNALWFTGRGIVIDENGKEIAKVVTLYKNLLLPLNFYPLLLITNYLMQPSVFVTQKTWLKYGPFKGIKEFIMEYDLWLKIGKIQMPHILNINLSKFRIEPETKTKQMSNMLLKEDENIINKYTRNLIVIFLHKLHNFGRLIIVKNI